MLQSELLFLIDYMDWARRKMFEALTLLTLDERRQELGGSFGSLQKTLEHMFWAEEVWCNRLYGRIQPSTDPILLEHLADLKERWEEVATQTRKWVEALPEEPVTCALEYTNSKGNPYTTPVRIVIQHLSHHQTYHRGQIMLMLRLLGKPAISTDLIFYHREQEKEP